MAGATFYTDILQTLSADAVVLTPNQRLAKYLQNLYQQQQMKAGNTCWRSPQILPINIWIQQLWQDYTQHRFAELPMVLNSTQETLLWQQILTASNYKDYFLRLAETAKLVKAARGLLLQWQVSTDHSLFDSAEDYTALKNWVNAFEQILNEKGWIDSASLPTLLTDALQNHDISMPNKIILIGFNELSPQIQSLLKAAKNAGSSHESLNLDNETTHQARISIEQQDDEWYVMAQWAKHLNAKNDSSTIGCVIPTLDKQRNRITQIFTEVFGDSNTYNISAGRGLSYYPVINTALHLLRLHTGKINNEELYAILESPFIAGGEAERLRRSAFDRKARQDNETNFTLAKLSENKTCPILAKRIANLKVLLEDKPKIAKFGQWAIYFNQMLTCLGWPGERILNSEEYQVVEQWLNLLQEMRCLDVTNAEVDIYQALQVLNQMATSKPFQPKTPAAKVQILGTLEAAGICFDHLWVSGMDDSAWPTQAKPNPFIPKALQRELKMPHSAAERELEYCNTMTHLFKASAGEIIFSNIKKRDETSLLPSPLIRDIQEISIEELLLSKHTRQQTKIFQSAAIEEIHDESGPAITAEEEIFGGVSVLKNQALCPFKAFAENRLHARKLEECIPGFTARDRGTIIHTILEEFWLQVKSQQALKNMHQAAYEDLLNGIIDKNLITDEADNNQTYIQLEKQRLFRLVDDWLQQEKLRETFTVIDSEAQAQAQIGALNLTVRIDRIDELEDGSQLIIDYKTGTSCTPGQWFSERPEEPQLPLYAYIYKDNVAAVAFAQVVTGNHKFKGISREACGIKGISTVQSSKSTDAHDWNEVTARWAAALNHLGNSFYQGHAILDPKKPGATCKYCGLQTLCRINQYGNLTHAE